MADLYANKLIDPEIFTQTPDMFTARSETFIYGSAISYGATAGHKPEIPGEEYWTDYRPLPVLKAPGVSNPVWERQNYGEPDKGVRNYNTQLVMTDKALGKEIAIIRWIDHLYNPDNIVRIQQGPLPNKPDLTPKYTKLTDRPYHYQWIDQTYWTEAQKKAYDYMWWGSLPHYGSKNIWEDAAGTPPRYKDMVDMQKVYAPFLETQLIPTKMAANATDTQRLSDIQPAIVDYVNGKMAEWISGQANVDAEWNTYIAQLDRLGVQELIQIKRRMAQ
jgi:putative aldouronate transport system substrate-binding protein